MKSNSQTYYLYLLILFLHRYSNVTFNVDTAHFSKHFSLFRAVNWGNIRMQSLPL